MDNKCIQIIGLHDICRQYDISLDQIREIEQNNHCINIVRISSGRGNLILKIYKICPLYIGLEDLRYRYETLNKLPYGLMPKPAAPPVSSDLNGLKLFGQLFYPIEGRRSDLASEENLIRAGKWLAHLHQALDSINPPVPSRNPINGIERMSALLPLLDRNIQAGSILKKEMQCIQDSLSHIERYQPLNRKNFKYENLLIYIPDHIWVDTGEYLINPNIDFLCKGCHTWDIANILQTIERPQSAYAFISSYLSNGGKSIIGLDLMVNMFLSRLNSLIIMSFEKDRAEQTILRVKEFAQGWCLDILKNRPFLVSPLTPELFRKLNINGF